MKTRIFSALAFTLMLGNAEASFNRFWIGYKLDSISEEAFLTKLNSSLVPDLIKLAGKKELSSYAPYVTPKNRGDLPHEIALITYKSEEDYRKLRSTKPGIAYGDLHWELFKKEVSKSTVPVQFDGILEIGQAYELDAKYEGWKWGHTYLTIYKRGNADLRKLADEFAGLKTVKGLKNSILLLTDKYIYEYRSLNPDYGFKPLSLKVVTTQKMKRARVEEIGPNEGLNVQF
jgi:hypothetical protein